MGMKTEIERVYEFGPFQVDIAERRLKRGDVIVPLTPKVIETLIVLLENNGRTVNKEELMQRLWPDTFVEESSLAQNVFQIRKALGETHGGKQYIETIPKRGYRFSAAVRQFPANDVQELIVKRHSETTVIFEAEREAAAVGNSTNASHRRVNLLLRTWWSWQLALAASLALILAVGIGTRIWQLSKANSSGAVGADLKTIAVLPFRPLDEMSKDEPIQLGMADALISRFSNLHQIAVRPTSAIIQYRDTQQNAIDAGRQLRVDAVLDGTIQRVGDRLRVNVQLVRIRDGVAIWSASFDGQFTDILALQDSISEEVSSKLIGKLSDSAANAPPNRYTRNIEAYQEYVRGRYFWNKRTDDGYRKGIEHFRKAIEVDPAYALAYAGLGDCYTFIGSNEVVEGARAESFERARAAVNKALELDPTLAEAQTTLALIQSDYDGNWQQAEMAYRKAIEFNPNYATAHHWYALDLMAAERLDQSLAEIKKAQELDPLSLNSNVALGQIYFYLRRYDDAIKQLQQTLELDQDHATSRVYLGLAYEQKGMLKEALSEFERVLQRYATNVTARIARAHLQALTNQPQQAKKTLDELQKSSNLRPFVICEFIVVNSALGHKDEAFRWFDKISRSKLKSVVIRLKFDPRLDELRTDPRFRLTG